MNVQQEACWTFFIAQYPGTNQKGRNKMNGILSTVFKAVGMAMGVAVIVRSILKAAGAEANIMLLGIGLFRLGLAALQKE
jgi:hypothetical protein